MTRRHADVHPPQHPEADVCVIGAGPAGCFAALHLARAGVNVLVLEEHAVVGEPVDCSGVIGAEAFRALDLPRASIIDEVREIELHSPLGTALRFAPPEAFAYLVDRAAFDRSLAELAIRAGARVVTRTSVIALTVQRDGVILETRQDGEPGVVRARAVVLAGGPRYRFQEALGMGRPRRSLRTVQAILTGTAPARTRIFFGREIAPGSFAWFLPGGRGEHARIKVGISMTRDAPGAFQRFMRVLAAHGLVSSNGVAPKGWIIPIAPIQRTFAERVLAVGDAAGQTKPTTGGGLYYGLLCAQLAAETLRAQLAVDRLAARDLAAYEQRWRQRLGRELRTASAFRRLVEQLSDRDLDRLFRLAQRDGFMSLIERRANFDWHRQLIAEICRKPRFSVALFQGFLRSWLPV